ncbi:hypothetical protein L1276_000580 [Flavobacterium sp. HSC-32F16]|nr:hypothetical protein [Flavobacterium sp. HSC-32F16]MCP2025440.1 hypothetical protein [Flavobacterium sp. HSC-32F16]
MRILYLRTTSNAFLSAALQCSGASYSEYENAAFRHKTDLLNALIN